MRPPSQLPNECTRSTKISFTYTHEYMSTNSNEFLSVCPPGGLLLLYQTALLFPFDTAREDGKNPTPLSAIRRAAVRVRRRISDQIAYSYILFVTRIIICNEIFYFFVDILFFFVNIFVFARGVSSNRFATNGGIERVAQFFFHDDDARRLAVDAVGGGCKPYIKQQTGKRRSRYGKQKTTTASQSGGTDSSTTEENNWLHAACFANVLIFCRRWEVLLKAEEVIDLSLSYAASAPKNLNKNPWPAGRVLPQPEGRSLSMMMFQAWSSQRFSHQSRDMADFFSVSITYLVCRNECWILFFLCLLLSSRRAARRLE